MKMGKAALTNIAKLFAMIVFMGISTSDALAQKHEKREKLKTRVDSLLTKRYNRINYDTNFIGRPKNPLTLKLSANVAGNVIRSTGTVHGVSYNTRMYTDLKTTMSVGASYRGIALSVALNPAHFTGRNHDFELDLKYFSNRFSFDVSYQKAKTLNGDIRIGDISTYSDKGTVDMKALNMAGYYVFNYKQFSYPAAFTQSYIQKRSAGSWLAGISYQGMEINNEKAATNEIPKVRIFVGNFAIGAGYGYNLVKGKWLFHLSALPTFIVIKRDNITINDERQKLKYKFPEMILNNRLSVVYNISDKYFISANALLNLTIFHSSNMHALQHKWYTRAVFGMRI